MIGEKQYKASKKVNSKAVYDKARMNIVRYKETNIETFINCSLVLSCIFSGQPELIC